MNRDRIEGNWKQLSGKVKERWGQFTDDQQCVAGGRRDQLGGRAQEQSGIAKEESRWQLEDFLYRNREWNPSKRK